MECVVAPLQKAYNKAVSLSNVPPVEEEEEALSGSAASSKGPPAAIFGLSRLRQGT